MIKEKRGNLGIVIIVIILILVFTQINNIRSIFNFASEVYRFTTTFDHDFIDKWNSICENVSTTVVAAIHLTTNLYGNGFTINMHNLCYPSLTSDVTIDGVNMTVPILDSTDLFRGPLVYLSLGAPKTSSTLGLSSNKKLMDN